MAILSSDWMFDEKIDALGDDHLAVRCFLAAIAAANADGTLGPVTASWLRMRLLPTGGVTAAVAEKAWKSIVKVGLVSTWEADGKTWAMLPGWWNHAGKSERNRRAVKSPDVSSELLDRYPRFAEGYLSCVPGKRSCESTTGSGRMPRHSAALRGKPQNTAVCRGMPSSSSSPSSSAFSSASKQASKLLEGGWPACWLLCDQDLKIGAEDRTLIERAFAHAGGRNVQPETVRKVVEQFGRDAGFARKAVAGLLERSADEPVRNFGMYLEGAVSDEIWARNEARQVEADQAAKRELADALKIRPPSPVEVGRIHAYLWQSGDRPEKWEACPCAACEQGRAVPA